jgi:hypothetical protein
MAGSVHLFFGTLTVPAGGALASAIPCCGVGETNGKSADRVEATAGESPGLNCWLNLVSSFSGATGGLGGLGAAAAKKRLAENELRRAFSSLSPFESKYI